MQQQEIINSVKSQRVFFESGETKNIDFRISKLKLLKKLIIEKEKEIIEAIKKDLGRCEFENYIHDADFVLKEIDFMLKNIKKLAKPQKVKSLPFSESIIYTEPYGCVLIISPWNYPFQLAIAPLVGAIAAGNCAIIKPSEYSVNTSKIISELINDNFASDYIKVIEGGTEESQTLLNQKFDYIFFTGGTAIGKIVYEHAAKNLTPVTLELGGKSPCIVDKNVNLKKTARRIVWGKFLNCGQTCIAPDYIFVNKEIKNELINELKSCIIEFYSNEVQKSPYYSRIINKKHFDHVLNFLSGCNIIFGGETDRNNLFIAPTLVDNVNLNHIIMQEEIFGPVLPIIDYSSIDDVINFINKGPKPLALYVFTNDNKIAEKVIEKTSSGGMCINDTLMHVISEHLPFGGVGHSGMGAYHGKYSFDTFSHKKSIFKNSFDSNLDFLYPPYKLSIEEFKKMRK